MQFKDVVVEYDIANLGNTPAEILELLIEYKVHRTWQRRGLTPSGEFVAYERPDDVHRALGDVGPGSTVTKRYATSFYIPGPTRSDEMMRRFREVIEPGAVMPHIEVQLAVASQMKFRDVFGAERSLQWCWDLTMAGTLKECSP